MEVKNLVNTKKIMLNYGLYLGLGVVAFSVVMYATGMMYSTTTITAIINLLLPLTITILCIVYGIKAFKTANGGFLTIGEAIKIGMGIAVIGGLINLLYTYVFMNYIEPDFVRKTMELQFEKMSEMNAQMTEEQKENAIEMGSKMAFFTYIGILIWSMFSGLIISLIAGAVMQKKEQTF